MTLLIGVLLLDFGYLLLPAFVYMGYQVAVLRTAARGADRPPSFGNWLELLLDGGKAFLVGLGFLVNPTTVALAVLGVYLGFSVVPLIDLASEIPVEQLQQLPLAVLVGNQQVVQDIASFVTHILSLGALGYASVVALGVVAYLYPVALVRFALDEKHSIDAARDFSMLAGVLLSPRYFRTWLTVLGLFIINWLVIWVPLYMPVGPASDIQSLSARLWRDLLYLMAYAVVFHLQISAAYLIARRYRDIRASNVPERPVQGLAQLLKARATGIVRSQLPVAEREDDPATGQSARPVQIGVVLTSLRQRMYGLITYPAGEKITLMLIIGTFAVTQSLDFFPLIISSGLIARVIRAGQTEAATGGTDPLPDEPNYIRWGRLLADGIRVLALWVIVAIPPIVLVVLWTNIDMAIAGPTAQIRLLTVLILGVMIGAGSALFLLFNGLYQVSVLFWSAVFSMTGLMQIDPARLDWPVGMGLICLLAVEGYLFPAAVANVVSTRRLVSGFSPMVVRRALSRRYLRGWIVFVTIAAVGFTPFIWWSLNSDSLGGGAGGTGPVSALNPELGQYLLPLPIGYLPVTEVLTVKGVPAHLLYLVVTFVYFYTQVVAFSIVGRIWKP